MKQTRFMLLFVFAACCGSSDDAAIASQGEQAIAASLVDPRSATFRNVRVVTDRDGTKVVCGQVNGKNAFGGYVDYRRFAWTASSVWFEDDIAEAQRRLDVSLPKAQTMAQVALEAQQSINRMNLRLCN